jgi:hypothetical protein
MSTSNVAYFKIHPGFNPEWIERAVDIGDKAVVIEGYVCGTIPTSDAKYGLLPAIRYATSHQVPVFLISATQKPDEEGYSLRVGYPSQVEAIKAGIIPLETPTSLDFPEVLRTLEQILSESDGISPVKEKMIDIFCKPGYYDRIANDMRKVITP